MVKYLAQFLLFDVVFWDNNPSLKELNQFKFDQKVDELYSDPLGWGFFVKSNQSIQFVDFQGQVKAQYTSGFKSINTVHISQDGRWIFIGDGSQKIEAFRRSTPEKKAIILSLPDQGRWSAYSQLNLSQTQKTNNKEQSKVGDTQLYSVFGTSAGNSWAFNEETLFKIHPTQDGSISAYTQRKDGRYWAYAVNSNHSSTPSKLMIIDQSQKTAPTVFSIEGQIIEIGFNDSFLWANTQKGWWMWSMYHKNTPTLHSLDSIQAIWSFQDLKETKLVQTAQGYQWIQWTHKDGRDLKIKTHALKDLPDLKEQLKTQPTYIESLIQSQSQLSPNLFKTLQSLLNNQPNPPSHPAHLKSVNIGFKVVNVL
jgi:hypothetical protein